MEKGDLLHEATLPVELTNSNDGQQKAWQRTHAIRRKFRKQLAGLNRQPFDVPTVVEVTRILGPRQRLWDYSSGFRGNYKQLEDTLVELGWWHDDSAKWIHGCVFRQDKSRRERGPAVQLKIWEAT